MTLPGTVPGGYDYFHYPPAKSDADIRVTAAALAVTLAVSGNLDAEVVLTKAHAIFTWIKTGEPVAEDPESLRPIIKDEVSKALRKAVG